MRVIYHPNYNIDGGILSHFHPFDGMKFGKVASALKSDITSNIIKPEAPVSQEDIDAFVYDLLRLLLQGKNYILRALELPQTKLITKRFIDNRVVTPMKWAVSGTILGLEEVLNQRNAWNLSGGFHHASRSFSEGFCLFNDIGIAHMRMIKEKKINDQDPFVIIDTDAHHGNGNASVFMDHKNCTILDIYNADIYPKDPHTRGRVDINIPVETGIKGTDYLDKLDKGLQKIDRNNKFAVVVSGTDVLEVDKLGGMKLSIEECVQRDKLVFDRLQSLSIPTLFLGGGGYSSDSAKAIAESLNAIA